MVTLHPGTKTDEGEMFSIGLNKVSEKGNTQLWTGRRGIQKVWYNKKTGRVTKTTGGTPGYMINFTKRL